MKQRKTNLQILLSLSVILLVSSSMLNFSDTSALNDSNVEQNSIDSVNKIDWKWTNTEVVSNDSTSNSGRTAIAVDKFDNLHIVWEDTTNYLLAGGDKDIFYRRWNATTDSWTLTEVVSTVSTLDSEKPSIAVDEEGDVYIAWQDLTNYLSSGTDWDLLFRKWIAATDTWTTTEVISTESDSVSATPHLALDDLGNIHVCWEDTSNYLSAGSDVDIFYKHWNVTTSSWTLTEVVSTGLSGSSGAPSMDVDENGNVYAVWYDNSIGGSYKILYKYRDILNSSWVSEEYVTYEANTDDAMYPSMDVDNEGKIHVIWYEDGEYEVHYRLKESVSSEWNNIESASFEGTTGPSYPKIKVDAAGNVHASWKSGIRYAGSEADYDIFYRYKDASSNSWFDVQVVSTNSVDTSERVTLAVDNLGHAYLTWLDLSYTSMSGSDSDIFLKKYYGPPSSNPELEPIIPITTPTDSVSLDWTDVFGATSYYIYRSTEFIGTITELTPIASSSNSEYIDLLPSAGYYFYVIVASNYAGNSSISNCVYVNYVPPDPIPLQAPEISVIIPNPTDIATISLDWDDIAGATKYYIYRNVSHIWSISGLNPINTAASSFFVDSLPSEGYFYYVVVAGNGVENSTISNCVYVNYVPPDPIPLQAPEMSVIIPNPSESSSISLEWDDVSGATQYYVYRSNAYIWSVGSLTPLVTVADSNYIDSLPSEDYYFYVIVATDGVTNSTHSNCVYVEYKLPETIPLQAPEMSIIIPNPTDVADVILDWDDVSGATEYYLYRSASYIWSISGMDPINTTSNSVFVDALPSEGYFFYVVVAGNGIENSTISNCVYVYHALPHVREFTIATSLLLGVAVISFFVFRKRKKS